jgi:hypothetical protein
MLTDTRSTEDAEVAPLQKDTEPHLRRLFADAIHGQATACSGNDAVPAAAKPDWQKRATTFTALKR